MMTDSSFHSRRSTGQSWMSNCLAWSNVQTTTCACYQLPSTDNDVITAANSATQQVGWCTPGQKSKKDCLLYFNYNANTQNYRKYKESQW